MRPYLWLAREILSGRLFREFVVVAAGCSKLEPATCPVCGYSGVFRGHGESIVLGAQCPKCQSLPRHRLLALAVRDSAIAFAGRDVLHFGSKSPETAVITAENPKDLVSANIGPQTSDLALNIEAIDLPDASFDVVVCSHVLEHVDDRKALTELHRILRPGGTLVAMVPIVEGWASTYEDSSIVTEKARHTHFGQYDHVRFYGRDFRDRIKSAGFELVEYTGRPEDVARFGLIRGETVFIGSKARD